MKESDVYDMIWGSAMDNTIYSCMGGPEREEIYKKLKNPCLQSKRRRQLMRSFIYVCKYEKKTGSPYKRLIFPF